VTRWISTCAFFASPLYAFYRPENRKMSRALIEMRFFHCDGDDSGCPQGIAKRGNYGSFLQDDWDTIYKMSESTGPLRPSTFPFDTRYLADIHSLLACT
jgi:hypothetical protein